MTSLNTFVLGITLLGALGWVSCGSQEICASPPSECNCPKSQDRESPVCASNGYSYYTHCEFSCAQRHCQDLKIVNGGVCNPEVIRRKRSCCNRVCSTTWAPVCGSDGHMYGNECEFRCERDCNPELKEMSSALQRHYQILKYCK